MSNEQLHPIFRDLLTPLTPQPKKSRADFSYRLSTLGDDHLLFVWDLNLGNMSVTNDIENVVADIAKAENIDPTKHLIIYRDSEGRWDGWDAAERDFFPIGKFALQEIAEHTGFNFTMPVPSVDLPSFLAKTTEKARATTTILLEGFKNIRMALQADEAEMIDKKEILGIIAAALNKL